MLKMLYELQEEVPSAVVLGGRNLMHPSGMHIL